MIEELRGFPSFAAYTPVQGLPPHERQWVYQIGFRSEPGDPRHAEAIFFVWFDTPTATHDKIAEALRQRARQCLELLG